MMTTHALERASARVMDAGFSALDVERMLARLETEARAHTSAAVFLARCPWQGDEDASTGDEVWGVVRDGRVVTLMLRRSTQPATPEALRVHDVVLHPGVAA